MADTEEPGALDNEELPDAVAADEEAAQGAEGGGEGDAEDGDNADDEGQYEDDGASNGDQQQQQASDGEDEGADAAVGSADEAGGDEQQEEEEEGPTGSAGQGAGSYGEQFQGNQQRQRIRSATSTDGGYPSERPSSVDSGTTSSRPLSAFRDLRGSRPNSAAIAAQIEGFDQDFMSTADDGHVLPDLPEHTEVQGDDDGWTDEGPCLDDQLAEAEEVQMQLAANNEALQRRVRAALEARNKGRPAIHKDLSRLEGAETRYKSALKQWHELLEEHERLDSHYQATVFSMKAALEERIARADDVSAAFKHFKKEVARAAEHSKTGQPISAKMLAKLEAREAELDDEVQRMRLRHITLANALKRCEGKIHNKEQLAEGLHLIDFEQLKMENQSLNEKIEERNEELIKLRKKTTTTVQILTHMKEKLQYVEKENSSLETGLTDLEASMIAQRDSLTQLKATRDALRTKGRTIKASSVYVTSAPLLADLEAQKERRDDLLAEAERLKEQHLSITAKISKASSKIIHASDEMRRGTHSSGHHSGGAARISTAQGSTGTPSRLNTAPQQEGPPVASGSFPAAPGSCPAASGSFPASQHASTRLGTAPGSPSTGSKFSRGSARTGTAPAAASSAYVHHSGLTDSGILNSAPMSDKW